jgi:hypothetical protein
VSKKINKIDKKVDGFVIKNKNKCLQSIKKYAILGLNKTKDDEMMKIFENILKEIK